MKLLLVLPLVQWCLMAITAARAEDTCGGTYRGFQYTITSPNYPSNYPTRTECVYRLEGEATPKCRQEFHLQFLDFNLKASEGCKEDYLQIGDKHLYCGNTAGLRTFTGTKNNNTLIVTFHSDDSRASAKGFKILVSALPCSLKLSPLRNSPPKLGVPEAGRSSWATHEIESAAYRRGIRGDHGVNNSLTSSLNPQANDVSSSIRRDEVGSVAAASENNSIINGNHYYNGDSPRVTSYLFLPPKETNANVTLHYRLGPYSSISEESSGRAVTSLPTDFLPPRINSISSFFSSAAPSNVKKIGSGVPARNYGEPGLAYSLGQDYDPEPLSAADCDASSQLLQSNDASSERINDDYVQTPNFVYDPKYGSVGSGYYPPNAAYPGGHYPGGGTGSGFYPTYPSAGYPPDYPGLDPVDPAAIGSSPGPVAPGSECCRLPSSSRRFSIASPGFPGGLASSGNQLLSCRYSIVKSSPDVCRLRLNFRFFNFGADDPYCSLGHADVDGQRFCGCRTGQSLRLPFADQLVKTISIFGAGYPRSRLSGFLIDVTQEPCDILAPYPPAPYDPAYPGGYLQRRSVGASGIVPSPLDPNPLVRDDRDLGYSYPKPSLAFVGQDGEWIPKGQTHERFFAGNCQSRLFFDWAIASKEAFFKNARCTPAYGFGARLARSFVSPGEEESTHCEEINENQGEIKSPLYPNVYPGNLKKCYRLNRAPNFCKLEVYVRDFDLESSQDCTSDYLSFSVEPNKKYCGRSLNDFRTVFDLTQTGSLEVDFVSDDRGTGRGFDMAFSQLPCEPTSTL